MRKTVAGIIGILLILASLQLQPARSTPGGPMCLVPTDYATIGAAVAVSGCTTIIVAAGTYDTVSGESFPISIGRNLTLQGAGAATTTIDATLGGLVGVIDVNGAVVNISGFTITKGLNYGLYYHGGASGMITNNTVAWNSMYGIFNDSSNPTIVNNIMMMNTGSGIRNQNSSNPTITDNLIIQSMAGIDNDNSSPTITNNTITRNSGGGITNTNSSNPTITNNIIVGFTAFGIFADGTSNPINTYNDVWNGVGNNYSGTSGGAGSISADPLYLGGLMGSDFHLQAISPAVNAGDNSAPGIPATDKDGNARISCGIVDMGAYEIQCVVPSQYEKEIPSILPLANTHISQGNNLAKQADDLLSQAESKNLDTATCEKMIKEAKEMLVKAKKVSANPIYANNLALEAMKKLRQAIDCLKALLG